MPSHWRNALILSIIFQCIVAREPAHPSELGSAPISRAISRGQINRHALPLREGEFVRLRLDQLEIDCRIEIAAPDGSTLVDLNTVIAGMETAVWVARQTGVYTIAIQAAADDAAKGRYRLRLDERRRAGPADQGRVAAQQDLERALEEQQPEPAIAHFQRCISSSAQVAEEWTEATCQTNLTERLHRAARFAEAVETANRAHLLWRRLGNTYAEAIALRELGILHGRMHDAPAAKHYGKEALARLRTIPDRRVHALVLQIVSHRRRTAGDLAESAATLDRAIGLLKVLGDEHGVAQRLEELSLLYGDSGDHDKALRTAVECLQTQNRIGTARDSAAAYSRVGTELAHVGRFPEAIAHLRTSAAIRRMIGDPSAEASSLQMLGEISLLTGQYSQALKNFDWAGRLSRRLRGYVSRTKWHLGLAKLEITENWRLRTMLRMWRASGGQQWKEASFLTADRMRTPHLAQAPLSLEQIRASLLDKDTVLLSYAPLAGDGAMWALTSTGLTLLPLPNEETLNALAIDLHRNLTSRNLDQPLASSNDRQVESAAAELAAYLLAPFGEQLHAKRILVVAGGPLALIPFSILPDPTQPGTPPLLANHEIVQLPSATAIAGLWPRPPSGYARSIAVLADPVFELQDSRLRPLIAQVAPGGFGLAPLAGAAGSATPAAALLSPASPSTADSNSAATLADASTRPGVATLPGGDDNTAFARLTGESGPVRRLTHSRMEAETILASAEGGRAWIGIEASRENVLSTDFLHSRILHFATHGISDLEDPERSGLLFSRIDRRGRPVQGFWRFDEIYNQRIRAELVVLAACLTAVGKDYGERGLATLSSAFLHAGATRVISSLWKVDDQATSALMGRFYELHLKRGLPAAAALRGAQLHIAASPRWRAPYYWAGFILQGHWK